MVTVVGGEAGCPALRWTGPRQLVSMKMNTMHQNYILQPAGLCGKIKRKGDEGGEVGPTLHSRLDYVQGMHNQGRNHTGAEAGNALDDGGRQTPMAMVPHIEIEIVSGCFGVRVAYIVDGEYGTCHQERWKG